MEAILRGVDLAATVPGPSGADIYRGIDLHVNETESLAILGRSGSGKSTLLSTLGLLQPPQHGEVLLHGAPVSKLSDSERARLRNRELGFVFQDYSLVPQLSVEGNLEIPLSYGPPLSKQERRRRIAESLALVDMQGTERRTPLSLSGGEQQRVAIARALVGQPTIILADEPTGALDVETGELVIEVLNSVTKRAGCCLVLVTHDPLVAARMDRSFDLTGVKAFRRQGQGK